MSAHHAHLRAVLDRASESDIEAGSTWYPEAARIARRIGRTYGLPFHRAAGIIAALSPRQQWAVNVRSAERVAEAYASGVAMPPPVGMGRSVDQAWRIANGERPLDVLNGPKVRAFYRNIIGQHDHVTLDTWALRALGERGVEAPNPALRRAAELAYREVAAERGFTPAQAQAIAWVVIRQSGYVRSNGVAVRKVA